MKRAFVKFSILFALLFLAGCEGTEKSQVEKWGLGKVESEYVSLNRDYDWYVAQHTTGVGLRVNCAPTCAIMAAKWSDADFSKTVADIRNDTYLYNKLGAQSGMYLHDLYYWLSANDIPIDREYQIRMGLAQMKEHLDNGDIMIVGINMYNISYNKNKEQRTGKFYLTFDGTKIYLEGANHAIVIKGYRVVDGITYFEVYGPASSEFERYPDGTFKGQDRYFLADEVISSGRRQGGDYLIISPKDTSDTTAQTASTH
jgi:hypothetical protein